MKRFVVSAVLLLVASMLIACGSNGRSDEATEGEANLTVAATTTIIADLAYNVAGDRAAVTAIIPAGADPHDFEPTPADVEEIADADLVLEHGLGNDEWAHELIEQSGTEATVIEVTEGVATIQEDTQVDKDEGDEHEDEGDHGGTDPHVWFDVKNAKVMTTNIRDALVEADPDGRETYEANAETYLAELDELDGWIEEQVATIPEGDRKLVTSHEAFGYFVEAYGFEYVGAVVPSLDTRAQASAQQIDELLELIEAEDVRAIFTETTVNPDLTEQIAAEANIAVVTNLFSDSLSDDGSETDTYIGMMRHNTVAIVEALAGDRG